MIKYRVLQTDNPNYIGLNLTKENLDAKNITFDDNIQFNGINNVEKESYDAVAPYRFSFQFYKDGFAPDFNNAGFSLPTDLNKNSFKKSSFVLEFYEQGDTLTWIGSETLGTYPQALKGPEVANGIPSSNYKILNEDSDLFILYAYRDFSKFKDVVGDQGRVFVKLLFQNALTGNRHYFVKSTSTPTVLTNTEFHNSLYYHEVRFFKNYTYGFFDEGKLLSDVYFKELVVKQATPETARIKPYFPPYEYKPPTGVVLTPIPIIES